MKLQGGQEAEAEFSRAGLRLKGTGYRLKTIAVMLRNKAGAVLTASSIEEPSQGGGISPHAL